MRRSNISYTKKNTEMKFWKDPKFRKDSEKDPKNAQAQNGQKD